MRRRHRLLCPRPRVRPPKRGRPRPRLRQVAWISSDISRVVGSMRRALLVQRVKSQLKQAQPGRHGRAAPRLGIRRPDQWTLRSRRWMPKRTSAATGTKNRSNAPWPPPPPVDDTPEFGGAGAFGASGGNGSGALGSAGGWERPPEAVLFTLEWTVAWAMGCAELELVASVALVCSSTRTDEPRL